MCDKRKEQLEQGVKDIRRLVKSHKNSGSKLNKIYGVLRQLEKVPKEESPECKMDDYADES